MAKNLGTLILFASMLIVIDSEMCHQESSCICTYSEYSNIDLTHTLGKDPIKAPFLNDTTGNYTVHYHGCVDGEFRLPLGNNNTCSVKGTLILINSTDSNNITCISLGHNSAVKFNNADDHVPGAIELEYFSGSKPTSLVSASVRLVCNDIEEPYIKVTRVQVQPILVSLLLNGSQVCKHVHHPGMSTGSVLVIIFLISIGSYFLGGAMVLYFIRGARGTELIPNVDFWRSLPGLVKDGTIFMLSGCNPGVISLPDSYDRI